MRVLAVEACPELGVLACGSARVAGLVTEQGASVDDVSAPAGGYVPCSPAQPRELQSSPTFPRRPKVAGLALCAREIRVESALLVR